MSPYQGELPRAPSTSWLDSSIALLSEEEMPPWVRRAGHGLTRARKGSSDRHDHIQPQTYDLYRPAWPARGPSLTYLMSLETPGPVTMRSDDTPRQQARTQPTRHRLHWPAPTWASFYTGPVWPSRECKRSDIWVASEPVPPRW